MNGQLIDSGSGSVKMKGNVGDCPPKHDAIAVEKNYWETRKGVRKPPKLGDGIGRTPNGRRIPNAFFVCVAVDGAL